MTAKKSTSSDPENAPEQQPLSFEDALAEIEDVVRDLESGQLGLQQSLARYEAGVSYLKQCHKALRQAERRIELLMGVDEDGNAETAPFDEEAMSLEEKRDSRSRRRSRNPAKSNPRPAEDDVDTQPGLF